MEKRKGRGKKIARIVLSVLLVIVLLIGVILYIVPLLESVDHDYVAGASDWMARLDGNLKLNQIVIPGTHDSATQYVGLPFFSRCQDLSIHEQLEAGFRYLDIRLGDDEKQLKLMHGFVNCQTGPAIWNKRLYLENVVDQCDAFLKEHPTETILFVVKQEHGDLPEAEFEKLMAAYVEQKPERWLLTDRIPTLDAARGKIVLMRRYEDKANLGAGAGIPLQWKDQGGHDAVSLNAAVTEENGYQLLVQDRYCYSTDDKWAAFTAGLEKSDTTGESISLHFLSTKGTLPYGHPYYFAAKLNPRLAEYPLNPNSGWILVDFATSKLAAHIYAANFTK